MFIKNKKPEAFIVISAWNNDVSWIKEYNTNKFFLVFAEDHKDCGLFFEEYPLIIGRLGGISTYFSEIEGFGNNLLEVLAAGVIPVVYTYPVFIRDIAKQKFKLVVLDKFEITESSLKEMVRVISSDRIKETLAEVNPNGVQSKSNHLRTREVTKAMK